MNFSKKGSDSYVIRKAVVHTLGLSALIFNVAFLLIALKINTKQPPPCDCEKAIMFSYPKSRRPLGFAPLMAELISLVDTAKHRIYVKAYGFTHPELGKSILRAAQRGVNVRLLIDHSSEKYFFDGGKLEFLYNNKLPNISIAIIQLKNGGIAHDKICVVDDKVWTGSFNFSKNADEKNEENAAIETCPIRVRKYLAHWEECFEADTTRVIKAGKWPMPSKLKPWK